LFIFSVNVKALTGKVCGSRTVCDVGLISRYSSVVFRYGRQIPIKDTILSLMVLEVGFFPLRLGVASLPSIPTYSNIYFK